MAHNEDFKERLIAKMDYDTALSDFLERNRLSRSTIPGMGDIFCYPEGQVYVQRLLAGESPFSSTEAPLSGEHASELYDPKYLCEYFRPIGYTITEPLPVVNCDETTLFVCAGVQILDGVMHRGDPLPEGKLFVAQPVVRTQFLEKTEEGASSSYVNIATESVNSGPEGHFEALSDWLKLLQQLGFKKSDFYFFLTAKERKWGSKKFTSADFRIRYAGLSIGTALYINDFPQDDRANLQISDIGLGLERIRWILSGAGYLDSLVEDKSLSAEDAQLVDCSRTLALFTISGLEPSNNNQGYRFRKFSKALVSRNTVCHSNVLPVIESCYDYWAKWVPNLIPKDVAIGIITRENQRNFNRELLSRLDGKFADVDIDINLPTDVIIRNLKGTSASKEAVQKVLQDLLGQSE